jgi:tetratricopeptide repeat protein
MTRRIRLALLRLTWLQRLVSVSVIATVTMGGGAGGAPVFAAVALTPQQKQEIHLHYERATRAYDLGKYPEAIDEYQKAYEIDGDPVMLYNIAQAYRLNDQPQDAVHFYRRYLQRSPDARNRDDVERKITALDKLLEERRKAAAAVTPPPPRPTVPALVTTPQPIPQPVVPSPTVIVTPQPAPSQPEPPSVAQKVVGWSMIGLGVAAGAVAVVEGISAKNYADKVTSASNNGGTYDPSWQTNGQTANIIAIVGGIAGTALAVAGAIVLITNGSSGGSTSAPSNGGAAPAPNSPDVSFAPVLGPGLAGAAFGLRF